MSVPAFAMISDRDGMEKSRESVMENVNFIKHALADDSDMIAAYDGYACIFHYFR